MNLREEVSRKIKYKGGGVKKNWILGEKCQEKLNPSEEVSRKIEYKGGGVKKN